MPQPLPFGKQWGRLLPLPYNILRGITMTQLEVPTKVSMRLSALSLYGGSLYNLYKSRRLNHRFNRSRDAEHACRKDFRHNGSRNYRPWQYASVRTA